MVGELGLLHVQLSSTLFVTVSSAVGQVCAFKWQYSAFARQFSTTNKSLTAAVHS
jgi:hypothetical protein